MLKEELWRYRLNEFDLQVYRSLLPKKHRLLDALELIDWDQFNPLLEAKYHRDMGQPAIRPLLMLKLEFLRYLYNLSDAKLIERAGTDVLFRWFLQIPVKFKLPDPSLLTKFRGRLGAQGFQALFNNLVAQARVAGLVKDRLRLKDASHVIADIAVGTTLTLFGQLRDRMLKRLEHFDIEAAEGFRIAADLNREQTASCDQGIKLQVRAELLQDILDFTCDLPCPEDAANNRQWQKLQEVCEVARKILQDFADPKAGKRTLSVVDSEARRGKHGDWYDGYVVDVLMDADSEIITQLDVLQAGGDEAKSAVNLIQQEQQAHECQIQTMSIDGIGFNGAMIRELEDNQRVRVITPPRAPAASAVLSNTEFTLSQDGLHVTCPAAQTSSYRQRDDRKNSTIFRFKRAQCDTCPLVEQCMAKPGKGHFGRSVCKSDFQAEYDRAQARAQTEQYTSIRREHPAIERKLNELMNHGGGRHARYRGQSKVLSQQLMTGFTINIKRMTKLLTNARVSALVVN